MDIRSVIVSIFATLAVSAGARTLYVDVAAGDDAAAAADTRRLVCFRTIQAAVDCAAAGDVVKVYPGVYDEGGAVVNDVSNRVHITKGITLEAVSDDPSTTVIQGAWDASDGVTGYGPAAVRCVLVEPEGATVVIKGFSLCDGASQSSTATGGISGGNKANTFLVDSVVRGCSGRSVVSCTVVRCRIYGTVGGDAAYNSTLVNSLVAGSQKVATIDTEPIAVRNSYAYNSTIVDNGGYGFRGSSSVYNSIVMQMSKGVTSANSDKSIFATNSVAAPWVNNDFIPGKDCITDVLDLFFSPASGDFRVVSGSPALTIGDPSHLARLSLPGGISAFVDLAGNAIPSDGPIAAGAYQQPVDPSTASGEILCRATSSAAGYEKGYSHDAVLRTENGPSPVRLIVQLTAGAELVCHSLPGVIGNALFPQMNGEVWTMTPPNGTTITNTPVATTRIYYVNPDPEKGSDENAGTSADAPLFTIQAAMDKITDSDGTVVHCAPGVYTNGTSASSRFYVKRGYVRVTGAGRDRSFVYGQKAPGTEDQDDGRGTGAFRCVYGANEKSCVQGFTLANGYTIAGSDNTSSRQGGIVYTSGDLFQVQDCTLSNGWAARGSVGYKGVYRRCLITRQNESAAVGTHFREAEAILSCLYVDNDGSAVDQPFFTDSASYGRMICQSSLVGNANKAVFNENYKVRNTLVGPSATIKATDVDGSLKTSSFSWSGVSTVTGGSYAGVAQGDYRLIGTSSAAAYGITPDYTWYTTDFTGKPFLPNADGKVPVGAFAEVLSGLDHYVDPVNGDDGNCGRDPQAPVKSLYAAFHNVTPASGSTVHLAAGTYGAEQTVFSNEANTVAYRLLVPAGVTVVGAGAERTILDAHGSSENPVRCVYAHNATVKGVTICNGYSMVINANAAGCSGSGTYVDCIISNNQNGAEKGTSACSEGSYYGCIVDKNRGKYTGYNIYLIENCLFGTGNTGLTGGSSDMTRGSVKYLENSIMLGGSSTRADTIHIGNTIFRSGIAAATCPQENVLYTNVADLAIGADYRLGADSVARDFCTGVTPNSLLDADVFGGQRVYNGVLDAGAVEYDCRGEFAAVLTKGTVVAAGADVTTNGVQGLVLPDGNALKVRFENAEEKTATIRIPVKVSGDGTLTLVLNGHPYASFTAADGAAECKIKNALAANDLVLSYDAGEGGEGSAEIGAALGPAGVLLLVR